VHILLVVSSMWKQTGLLFSQGIKLCIHALSLENDSIMSTPMLVSCAIHCYIILVDRSTSNLLR